MNEGLNEALQPPHITPQVSAVLDSWNEDIGSVIRWAVHRLDRHVVRPIERAVGLKEDAQRAAKLCARVDDGCTHRVLSGGRRRQADQFLGGLGDLFSGVPERWETKRSLPARTLGEIGDQLEYLVEKIEQRVSKACSTRGLKTEEDTRRKFYKKVLGTDLLEAVEPYLGQGATAAGVTAVPDARRQSLVTSERLTGVERELTVRLEEAEKDLAESQRTVAALREENERLQQAIQEVHGERKVPASPTEAEEKYPAGAGVDPLEFLKQHYGCYLSHFGAPETVLYQDQLRRFDEGLFRAVENRLYYLRTKKKEADTPRMKDVVPPKKDRTTKELNEACGEEFLKKPRLVSAAAYRVRLSKNRRRS